MKSRLGSGTGNQHVRQREDPPIPDANAEASQHIWANLAVEVVLPTKTRGRHVKAKTRWMRIL